MYTTDQIRLEPRGDGSYSLRGHMQQLSQGDPILPSRFQFEAVPSIRGVCEGCGGICEFDFVSVSVDGGQTFEDKIIVRCQRNHVKRKFRLRNKAAEMAQSCHPHYVDQNQKKD